MTAHVHEAFRHEALFYADEDDFLAGTVPFVRDGVAAGEPVLVAVTAARKRALERALNENAEGVLFADMEELGRNPACIIPAWRDFVAHHGRPGGPRRGIGEPIWATRSAAELVECQRHEFLLNLAFASTSSFWLLCPYDTEALDPEVLDVAEQSHPFIAEDRASRNSAEYVPPSAAPGPFDGELPAPARRPMELQFGSADLRLVRRFVSTEGEAAGLGAARAADLVLAVSELATNSVLHAGGHGTLRFWQEAGAVLCEVQDDGSFKNPLLGRERPLDNQLTGRGLWMVNRLCDLVQMRSSPAGNVARLHMSLADAR